MSHTSQNLSSNYCHLCKIQRGIFLLIFEIRFYLNVYVVYLQSENILHLAKNQVSW